MNNLPRYFLYFLLLLTGGITIIFLISIWNNFDSAIGSFAHWESTGQVGDFVGGVIGTVVSAIGSILIYMTLDAQAQAQNEQTRQFLANFNAQQQSNADQREEFLISEIEGRFFELLRLHKDNLSNIVYHNDKDTENDILTDRRAIQFIVKQIEDCYQEINLFFEKPRPTEFAVFQPAHLTYCQNLRGTRSTIDLIQLAHIDIAYSIVFFGTSEKDMPSLKKLLERYYQVTFTFPILRYIEMKSVNANRKEAWEKFQKAKPDLKNIVNLFANFDDIGFQPAKSFVDENDNYFNLLYKGGKFDKHYGGHQYKLGQYFRHLFQTVKYIDRQEVLSYEKKYDYLKTLRAQLSTVEQSLIFYNSISFMGRAWELTAAAEVASGQIKNQDVKKQWLFTKYNFIKNIPDLNPSKNLHINNYYPEIHFEFEDMPVARKDLETFYQQT